jgi:phospholipase D1/2
MSARAIYVYAAVMLLLVAAGAWAWRADLITPETLRPVLERHAHDSVAPLVVILVYVVGGLVLVPVMALIAVTGFAFGPGLGAIYALLGALASAACSYAMGRCFAERLAQRYAGPRIAAIRKQLDARGLVAVILVRLVPAGPYTLVNLVAGASGIRWRDFLLGTLIGMTPGVVLTVGLVHGLQTVWQAPGPYTVAAFGAAAAGVLALVYAMRRALGRRRSERTPHD